MGEFVAQNLCGDPFVGFCGDGDGNLFIKLEISGTMLIKSTTYSNLPLYDDKGPRSDRNGCGMAVGNRHSFSGEREDWEGNCRMILSAHINLESRFICT
jgi:hypothetical protein